MRHGQRAGKRGPPGELRDMWLWVYWREEEPHATFDSMSLTKAREAQERVPV